jgi:hypothetical protein
VRTELAAAFKNYCDVVDSKLRSFIIGKITPGVA